MVEKPLLSVEEAEKILNAFPVEVKKESLPLLAAQGRYLAQDICSPFAMPEFDKSAMDGFACISEDHSPAYEIIETIAAGTPPQRTVTSGHCARIMTGAMLPAGADRVVRREYASEENGFMRIRTEEQNRNIRKKGEDLQAGQLVLSAGERLRPAQIALLASLGMADAPTARPPRVGIITTGSELVDPGGPLAPGQIYNSNSYSLSAQIREAGADAVILGRVADHAATTREAIARGKEKCDVLILSGGVSAGDFDFVPAALVAAGFTLHFEKISVQPGMPTVFASRGDKIAFGLPGNPVSTFVIFEVFIKPLLLRLMGHAYRPLVEPALLASGFSRVQDARTAFIPVSCRGGRAELVSYHGSAHLHSLSQANAILRVPAGLKAFAPGSIVDVRFL